MPKYAIDTNVFIDALRSGESAAKLKRFLVSALPITYMSAVVALELRAGARTREQVRALEMGVLRPFDERGRLVVPSSKAYLEAGRILAGLHPRGRTTGIGSLSNDALLAASCRETGITLITRDADFGRIAPHLSGFRHIPPLPR